MIYPFRCDNCSKDLELNAPMREGPPKVVICPDCAQPMHRIWTTSVVIPEHMKAADDMHTAICSRMRHASRPSGRAKTLW